MFRLGIIRKWLQDDLKTKLISRMCMQVRDQTLRPQLTPLAELCAEVEKSISAKIAISADQKELLKTFSEKETLEWEEFFESEMRNAENNENQKNKTIRKHKNQKHM